MSGPVATTTAGKVRGISHSDGKVLAFKGIPFAAPPTGKLRHRPPAPVEKWDGTRDATQFGASCPQVVRPVGGPLGALSAAEPMDEDCLFLNVWTPGLDDAQWPVMVWIHGGAFTSGSGSAPMYDGATFARDGIVYVSVNYRLHALGFLDIDELFDGYQGSGNCGILDQLAALEWVRDNIRAFGGDPGNVTIFGESAGGTSVGTLLGTPSARGLFRRAVAQSGGHRNLTSATATRVAKFFLENLNVKPGDIDALLSSPVGAIVASAQTVSQQPPAVAAELLADEIVKTMVWRPVVDGVVRDHMPIEHVAAGTAKDVAVLVGNCAEEFRLFRYGMPEPIRDRLPLPDVASYFAEAGRSADEVVKAYESRFPTLNKVDILGAVDTDLYFGVPAVRLAEAQSGHNADTWMYRFSWRSPAQDLGACHALDIPFVFENLSFDGFHGLAAPPELAEVMHRSWLTFASTGDPNTEGLPKWPRFSTETRQVMDFDSQIRVVSDPDAATRPLWDGVV